jgi:predicted ArsR family transcriptional regulator
MTQFAWSRRFLESTRGRVLDLVRRGHHTVDDLAARLGLTDNAVRAHLAALERDGVVRAEGVIRAGVGKPATRYGIAPEAEPAFSAAYVPLLQTLLASLADDLPRERLTRLMRDVGRRLAATVPTRRGGSGTVHDRAKLAAQFLDDLGGISALHEERGRLRLVGTGCPLSAVVAGRPEVCGAVTAMLGEIVGTEVRQCCHHGERPQCEFEIALRRGR